LEHDPCLLHVRTPQHVAPVGTSQLQRRLQYHAIRELDRLRQLRVKLLQAPVALLQRGGEGGNVAALRNRIREVRDLRRDPPALRLQCIAVRLDAPRAQT
jgi:hypothetical protein